MKSGRYCIRQRLTGSQYHNVAGTSVELLQQFRQVCAFSALTVRKHSGRGHTADHRPGDFKWPYAITAQGLSERLRCLL